MTETMPEQTQHDPAVESGQADYWGTDVRDKFMLPDGVSYIEIRVMNEGARARFQKENNQDMRINRRDDSASISIDAAKERHALIKASVVGWNLKKGGQTVDFTSSVLNTFLEHADPKIVDDLEFFIRRCNPWLQADMSVEDYDKEIDRLVGLRDDKIKSDAGNVSSPSN